MVPLYHLGGRKVQGDPRPLGMIGYKLCYGLQAALHRARGVADRALEDTMTPADFLAIRDLRLPSVLPEDTYEVYGEKSQNQLKMALVADVATDAEAEPAPGLALFMGVGTPHRLSVYINDKSGGFRVTEGYMFSYYTFTQALEEGRMNDDRWKAIVYDPERQDDLKKYLPAWHGKLYE